MVNMKQLTISDIQTEGILFFEPALAEKCFTFCQVRDIEYLPALDDPWVIFKRDDETQKFIEKIIDENDFINGDVNLFSAAVLEKFAVQPLLLVYNGNELSGVVHFSDYNKPVVSLYLYELLFNYERALRSLLILHGYDNTSMIGYFEKKSSTESEKTVKIYTEKIREYNEKGRKKKLPAFEVFYLTDLVEFTKHEKLISPPIDGKIYNLRNMVMHNNQFVEKKDSELDNMIYDFATFKVFFELVTHLHRDLQRVSNYLAFMR